MPNKKKILITGGAGFIGVNAASYFLTKGYEVTLYDNLSRKGSRTNLKWIQERSPRVRFISGEITNGGLLKDAVKKKDIIIHLAAQVSVTSSVIDPENDFKVNVLGTFRLLEAIRLNNPSAICIYSSTNKVYGEMLHIPVEEKATRYTYKNLPYGISEDCLLDFHSPYGCSKGAADQYVIDYSRIYAMNTIVFRQSCIYGPHQFGIEDQGWIAWFIIAALKNQQITIYGNGKQVRDVLHIQDLIRAYDLAISNIKKTRGQAYNIGGGSKYMLSVWKEFGPLLEKKIGKKLPVIYKTWRPGDQKIYVSDIRKAKRDFQWIPAITPEKGIEDIVSWIQANYFSFRY